MTHKILWHCHGQNLPDSGVSFISAKCKKVYKLLHDDQAYPPPLSRDLSLPSSHILYSWESSRGGGEGGTVLQQQIVFLFSQKICKYVPSRSPSLWMRAWGSFDNCCNQGLIKYKDNITKFRYLKQLICKGTLRQVFIRVFRLEIQSVMLVFSTLQLCELLPL
jgi:hypothetical protein